MTKMEYFRQNNEEVKSIAFIGTHAGIIHCHQVCNLFDAVHFGTSDNAKYYRTEQGAFGLVA